jgi:hypothetical protein
MDTLAYLHCASSYDEAPQVESLPALDDEPLFNGLNWTKLSSSAFILLMPFAVALGVVGMPQQAEAYGCGGYSYTSCKRVRRVIHRPKYYVKHYPVVIRRPVYHYRPYPVIQTYPVVIRRPRYIHVTHPVFITRPRYIYKDVPVVIHRPKYIYKYRKHKAIHHPKCFGEAGFGCGDSFDHNSYHHTSYHHTSHHPVTSWGHDRDDDGGFAVYRRPCINDNCTDLG